MAILAYMMGKNKKKRDRSQSQDSRPSADGNNDSHSAPKKKTIDSVPNPMLKQQQHFLERLTDAERHEFFAPNVLSSDRRAKLWMDQADLGERLVNQYAWATPTPEAMKVLNNFSPLVELGCGANAYWCRLLHQAGVDIVGYDLHMDSGSGGQIASSKKKKMKERPSFLKQGGPDVLVTPALQKSGRTLFLCYPDEDEEEDEQHPVPNDEDEERTLPTSLGWQCLHHYTGDYVIHVGELLWDATLGLDQAPWGRSSAAEFQQRLASEYHCLLKMELPNWVHTRDTLSVWKRSSQITSLVFAEDSDDEGAEEVEYRHIPLDERLPVNLAAPCLAHLLLAATVTAPALKKTQKKKHNPTNSVVQVEHSFDDDDKESPIRNASSSNSSGKKKKQKKDHSESTSEGNKKQNRRPW